MRRVFSRSQKLTIIYGILCIVIIIDVLQLWLLSATMNAFLAGHSGVILPAAIASSFCFFLNFGLLVYIYLMERP
jgi:hypothetical protein